VDVPAVPLTEPLARGEGGVLAVAWGADRALPDVVEDALPNDPAQTGAVFETVASAHPAAAAFSGCPAPNAP
jgi:hypothetical protein